VQCDGTHPCSSGQSCEENVCRGGCQDAGCPLSELGKPEYCEASGACLECERASDCQSPLVCLDGGCSLCSKDADCALFPDGGQACSGGACLQCHVGQASDPFCPDAGACNQEGICCGTPGFPC
jgi:hypothetical protein